uniref:Uncharacterized protein n=1 Tax=Fagus sylvatica TaxID=28930 RepID=A0A2N9IRD2_FAGSY
MSSNLRHICLVLEPSKQIWRPTWAPGGYGSVGCGLLLWIWLWIWSRLGLNLRWLNSCGGVFVGLWWPVMGLCWVCGGGGGGGGWEGFGLWLLGLYG